MWPLFEGGRMTQREKLLAFMLSRIPLTKGQFVAGLTHNPSGRSR
jgi:hypothetical protein